VGVRKILSQRMKTKINNLRPTRKKDGYIRKMNLLETHPYQIAESK
jgi:hypothetical protein